MCKPGVFVFEPRVELGYVGKRVNGSARHVHWTLDWAPRDATREDRIRWDRL